MRVPGNLHLFLLEEKAGHFLLPQQEQEQREQQQREQQRNRKTHYDQHRAVLRCIAPILADIHLVNAALVACFHLFAVMKKAMP